MDRKTYWKRKSEGICIYCGKRPARPGRISCEPCAVRRKEADAELYRRKKEAGICIICRKNRAEVGSNRCAECMSEEQRAMWEAKYPDRFELTGTNVSEVITALRCKNKMNLSKAAKEAGTSRQNIGQWESGKFIPNLDNLEQYIKSMGYRLIVEKMEE